MTYQLIWHGTRIADFAFGCLNLIINRPGPTGCPSSTTWFLRLSCSCCTFEMSEPSLSPFIVQTYRDNNVSTNVAHFNAIIGIHSLPQHPYMPALMISLLSLFNGILFGAFRRAIVFYFLSNDLSISHYKACGTSTVNFMHFLFKLKIDHC